MTEGISKSLEFVFVCSLSSGLHARPASHLAEAANEFASDCVLTNLRNRSTANLKSVLSIIAADVRHGDRCSVAVGGSDQHLAHSALLRFVEQVLPECDVPLAGVGAIVPNGALPRVLRPAQASCRFGFPASRGIASGKVVTIDDLALESSLFEQRAANTNEESERAKRAITTVRHRIREKLTHAASPTEAAVLNAHLAIASDVSLAQKLAEHVSQGASAAEAVVHTGEFFISLLRHSESELIRERVPDIEEICLQLLEVIEGSRFKPPAIELREPSVVVTETLAPQQLLGMDRRYLRALVLEYSGSTSHAVILARSLGIPTLVGVKGARLGLTPGDEVVVDANRGFLLPLSAPRAQRFYERESKTQERRRELLRREGSVASASKDGKPLEIAANVSSSGELAVAFENGADGIGLFRTEMLFLRRDRAPNEEEQFALYAEAARAAVGRRVIIRTLDVGGDKPVPYLNLPREENPFLGYRGARIYAEHQALLHTQLRAILRASALGRVQIMAPMISSLPEVFEFKAAVSQAQQDLSRRGFAFAPDVPIGIMIEVPSIAFALEHLCTELDFFSIGTNDLSQYFFAADRGNPKIAGLASVRHPSFLLFLQQIVQRIHQAGKWVGMCGEMAADIEHLPLLVGLGLDEISLASPEIPRFKKRIAEVSWADCQQLLSRAVSLRTASEVEKLLQSGHPAQPAQPLLSEDLVLLGNNSQCKEEAIQDMVDAFYIAGRTEDRYQLEEDLWAREAVYSTGLGHGFATPHCKTAAVAADSIGILKLNQPIHWGSVDKQPVHTIILIAMRDSASSNRHMKVFSRLARKLMSEEFREHLLNIHEREGIVAFLTQQLLLSPNPTAV